MAHWLLKSEPDEWSWAQQADKRLKGMPLVRLGRLSVQPVSDAEWRIICEMAGLES